MAGLTKEQRAAKAAQEVPKTVLMERDGKVAEVRNGPSVKIMEAQGWKIK